MELIVMRFRLSLLVIIQLISIIGMFVSLSSATNTKNLLKYRIFDLVAYVVFVSVIVLISVLSLKMI